MAILRACSHGPRVHKSARVDPTFVPKSGFFTNLGQGLSNFGANCTTWLFRQNVGSFKQEIHLCLISGFLAVVFAHFKTNIICKVAFSLKRQITLIYRKNLAFSVHLCGQR